MSNFLNGFLNGFTFGMLRSTPMFGCFNFFNTSFYPYYPLIPSFSAMSSVFNFGYFRPPVSTYSDYKNMPQLNQSVFNSAISGFFSKNYDSFDTFNKTDNSRNKQNFNFNSLKTSSQKFEFDFNNIGVKSKSSADDTSVSKTIETSTKNCTLDDATLDKLQEYLRTREGDGTHTDPYDSGGKTNRGVTHDTYDNYRRQHGLPLQDVSKMTLDEHKKIIKWFWDLSGASKEKNPRMAFYRFALKWGGCSKFNDIVTQSGGDPDKFEKLRRDYYYSISQPGMKNYRYRNGWQNRVTWDKQFAEKYFPNTRVAA